MFFFFPQHFWSHLSKKMAAQPHSSDRQMENRPAVSLMTSTIICIIYSMCQAMALYAGLLCLCRSDSLDTKMNTIKWTKIMNVAGIRCATIGIRNTSFALVTDSNKKCFISRKCYFTNGFQSYRGLNTF